MKRGKNVNIRIGKTERYFIKSADGRLVETTPDDLEEMTKPGHNKVVWLPNGDGDETPGEEPILDVDQLHAMRKNRQIIVKNSFYLDFFHQGKRVKLYSDDRGLRLSTREHAKRLWSTIEEEMRDRTFDLTKYRKAEVNKFWATTLLDKYRDAKMREWAPSNQANQIHFIESAKAFFSTTDVREIKKIDLVNYRISLEERSVPASNGSMKKKKLSPIVVRNYLVHFRAFLNFVRTDLELISVLPNFPRFHIPKPIPKWVGEEDQIKILEYVPEADRPLFRFLFLQGCRPSEATALRVADVDLKNQSITISATWSGGIYRQQRKGQGAEPAVIYIHSENLEYISARVKSCLPGAWLFPNPRTGGSYSYCRLTKIWRQTKRRANIEGLSIYQCSRHSVASNLIKKEVPIFIVSKILGHKDIRTTQKYCHVDIESQRISLEKLSLKKPATVHDLYMEGKEAKNAVSAQ